MPAPLTTVTVFPSSREVSCSYGAADTGVAFTSSRIAIPRRMGTVDAPTARTDLDSVGAGREDVPVLRGYLDEGVHAVLVVCLVADDGRVEHAEHAHLGARLDSMALVSVEQVHRSRTELVGLAGLDP